jgi:hypothetical protein
MSVIIASGQDLRYREQLDTAAGVSTMWESPRCGPPNQACRAQAGPLEALV